MGMACFCLRIQTRPRSAPTSTARLSLRRSRQQIARARKSRTTLALSVGMWRRLSLLFVLLVGLAFTSRAQLDSSPALGALEELELSKLSQRDLNPLGEKALAI